MSNLYKYKLDSTCYNNAYNDTSNSNIWSEVTYEVNYVASLNTMKAFLYIGIRYHTVR